jgi:hypothetical protein
MGSTGQEQRRVSDWRLSSRASRLGSQKRVTISVARGRKITHKKLHQQTEKRQVAILHSLTGPQVWQLCDVCWPLFAAHLTTHHRVQARHLHNEKRRLNGSIGHRAWNTRGRNRQEGRFRRRGTTARGRKPLPEQKLRRSAHLPQKLLTWRFSHVSGELGYPPSWMEPGFASLF